MIEIVKNSEHITVKLPILASEKYLKSASNDYGWFVDSQFVLPFFTMNLGFTNYIVFTTQSVYLDPEASIEQEKNFLSEVIALCKKNNVDFIGQPKTTAIFNTFPTGSIHMEWGSYQVDLLKNEDKLFSDLHEHHRRVIRKAQRDGVVIMSGPELVRECHELIRDTLKRQRKPYVSLEQLKIYKENLQDHINFYLAKYNGVNQACAVLVSDSASAYYIHGGSCVHPHNGAAAMLHWTAIQDMKNKGVKTYNFVGGRINPVKGSKQESIQVFKSRFGSHFKKGYLWKYPLTPWKYQLFQTWYRLKDWASGSHYYEDIIDNELRTAQLDRSTKIIN